MPRTKSAAKSARQSKVKGIRLQPYKTNMKTMMKKLADSVKAGKKDDAQKLLPQVYKSIDMAAKKRIIHRKTAARKKSVAARLLASSK